MATLVVAVPAGAGVDESLCKHDDGRADVPASFALDACFDGTTLVIVNRATFPLQLRMEGDRGEVEKFTDDAVPDAASRVMNDAYSFDPTLIFPGYGSRIAVGEGEFTLRLQPEERIARRHALADAIATYVPLVGSAQAFVDLVNELDEVWENDQTCRSGANWAREIRCEAIYLRDLAFALGRAVAGSMVGGLPGFVLEALGRGDDTNDELQKWVDNVGDLHHSGTIRIDAATEIGTSPVTPPATAPPSGQFTPEYLAEQATEFDAICRGQSGDEASTWLACDVREGFVLDLASQGRCVADGGQLESCDFDDDSSTFTGFCPDIPGTSTVAVAGVSCAEAEDVIASVIRASSETFSAGRFTCVGAAGAVWCGDYGVDTSDVETSYGAVTWRT